MRRSIPLIAATLGLGLVLAGCGSGGETPAKPTTAPTSSAPSTDTPPEAAGELTIWVDDTRKAPVAAAAKAFEADTGAKVKIVEKNFDDIRTDFIAQVPTGKGPDLTVGAHDWLGELIKNGVVDPVQIGDIAGDFSPVAVDAFTYEGQVYGLPYAIENIALIRNVDLADKAPATWDDAMKAGKDAGKKFPILLQSNGEDGDPYTYYPLQTSFGLSVFAQNDDGSYTSELAMGGEKGHKFATFLQEQGKAGNLSIDTTYDIAVEQFAKGNSPFIIGGPWMLEKFKDMNIAIDPLPSAGGEPARPFTGVAGFYVNKNSENKILANSFLTKYIATKDVQVALYEAGDRTPALTAAADEIVKDNPIAEGFRTAGKDAFPMPSIPEMAAVWTFWGNTEGSIVAGKADPVKAWDKMIADIQKAIDKA